MDRLEKIILKNLIHNDDYSRKVLPFLKTDYFSDRSEKVLFEEITLFVNKYKSLPTNEALVINVSNRTDLSGQDVNSIMDILSDIHDSKDEKVKYQWLIDNTESFCQDKAVYNAIMEAVAILGNAETTKGRGEIPKLLSDSLSISFDNNVGHDYVEDYEHRYDLSHKVESKIRFDLDMFNRITKGGLSKKTLNMILAGTGVGKSLFMCHMAAACLSQGDDVLYITMEMSEEKIADRIDANLLDISLDDLAKLPKEEFLEKFKKFRSKTLKGKLIIKEYPTAQASTLHFRALLNDLKLKKNFVPKIIFVDYINICCSSRLKQGANVNSYTYIKSIAEELRGLAVEFDVPIVSATQTTRSGYGSSDPGLEDTSESFGLPATADLMFALITNEELEKLNQILVKQLKNRYSDLNFYKRFVIGVDKGKMRIYDAEESAQAEIIDSGTSVNEPTNLFTLNRGTNKKFNNLRT